MWDMHMKKVAASGKKKVNQLHSVISNRDINLSARRLLLLAVIRPTLEYGSEVWEANKAQAGALESVVLGGANVFLVVCQGLVMRLSGGTWDWNLYRVVGIRPS